MSELEEEKSKPKTKKQEPKPKPKIVGAREVYRDKTGALHGSGYKIKE